MASFFTTRLRKRPPIPMLAAMELGVREDEVDGRSGAVVPEQRSSAEAAGGSYIFTCHPARCTWHSPAGRTSDSRPSKQKPRARRKGACMRNHWLRAPVVQAKTSLAAEGTCGGGRGAYRIAVCGVVEFLERRAPPPPDKRHGESSLHHWRSLPLVLTSAIASLYRSLMPCRSDPAGCPSVATTCHMQPHGRQPLLLPTRSRRGGLPPITSLGTELASTR